MKNFIINTAFLAIVFAIGFGILTMFQAVKDYEPDVIGNLYGRMNEQCYHWVPTHSGGYAEQTEYTQPCVEHYRALIEAENNK